MRYFEVDGNSPEEILNQFLSQQNVPAEFVEMEVIDPGKKGVLGLGRRQAKVKIKLNDYEYLKRKTRLYLSEILSAAGFDDYHIEVIDNNPECVMNIVSKDANALTGRSAVVLDSLQYLVDRLTRIDSNATVKMLVDVDNYRKKVIEPLKEKAVRLAQSVKKNGKPVRMQPMVTLVRREIHIAAKTVPGVTTVSNGDGQIKTLTILPERKGGSGKYKGKSDAPKEGGQKTDRPRGPKKSGGRPQGGGQNRDKRS